jgi:multidrug efflux pump subunit AcrA (membrane-fusion protein)
MIDLRTVRDKAKAKKGWLIGGVALFCIILLIKSCTSSSGPESSDSSELDRFFEVNRGDFNITILARGELEAIKNYEIKFTGKGKLGLFVVSLLDDKTEVKAGDTVLSLDNVSYLEEIKGLEEDIYDTKVSFDERLILEEELLETSLRNLEEDLDNSILNISLFLEDQNIDRDKEISGLTEKTNAYETAQDALVQYKNLDYRSKSKGMQADIDTKEQAYFEATDELEKTTQALSEARLKDEDTREKAERNVLVAEKKMENAMDAWENARRADRQFRRYDHPQTLRKLNIAAEKTELDLKQNLVQAQSKRVQAERRYKKLLRDKETIIERIADRKEKYSDEVERVTNDFAVNNERLNERLAEMQDDLSKLDLTAPIDGFVTIGAEPDRRGREPKEITVGTKVAPNEVVARIPDLSQFLIRCNIPEIYRSRLKVGQIAYLKNAALPELNMQGALKDIATMSQPIVFWDQRSPRVYETKLSTQTTDPRLVPGMTVEVEIQVEQVQDVLYLPIESIYNLEGTTYCQVKTGFSVEEREIETGRASNSFVEITEGLAEGETVLLYSQGAANLGS